MGIQTSGQALAVRLGLNDHDRILIPLQYAGIEIGSPIIGIASHPLDSSRDEKLYKIVPGRAGKIRISSPSLAVIKAFSGSRKALSQEVPSERSFPEGFT